MRLAVFALILVVPPAVADTPRIDAHGDPLPRGAIARLGSVRFRLGTIGPYAVSPDGKTLAVETATGIILWDVDTGLPGIRIPMYGNHVGTPIAGRLAFTADGKTLLCAHEQVVRVFDVRTGRLRFSVGFADTVQRVSAVADAARFAVVEKNGHALVFSDVDGRLVTRLKSEATLERLTPSGRFFFGKGNDGLVLVDATTGATQVTFESSLGRTPTTEHVFTPDERLLYWTNAGRLHVCDTRTGRRLETVDALPGRWPKEGRRLDLALSPDGTVGYFRLDYEWIHRRDLKAGKWLEPIPVTGLGPMLPHPDGKRLLIVCDDGLLRRYELATGREIASPDGFDTNVEVLPSPEGRLIATTSSEGRIDLFDSTGRQLWSARTEGTFRGAQWTPDGRTLACMSRRELVLRDGTTGKTSRTLKYQDVISGYEKQARIIGFYGDVVFTPDGTRVVLTLGLGYDLRVRIAVVDVQSGNRTLMLELDDMQQLAMSPDGRTLAATQTGRNVAMIDLATGAVRPTADDDVPLTKTLKPQVKYSPDGSLLLTWEDHGIAVLRDPDSGARLRKIDVHQNRVHAFAFSPDGLWLATGGDNGLVALWDVITGEQVWAQGGHPDRVTSLGFAGPRRLLTSSRDLTALVWDLRATDRPKKQPWDALVGPDPRSAYESIWALADDPTSPSLLRSKITPVKYVSAEQIQKWIVNLGAPRYATRETATTALRVQGRLAESELRALRAKTIDEEVRTRLDALLTHLPRERSHAEIVQARAVAAMEIADTPEAKKLLAEWASGAAGARLTIDAKAALARMANSR